MNDFIALMNKRRSQRKYTNAPVESEKLETIIQAALLAPSSRSIYPCDFIVINDRTLLEKLSVCKPHGAGFIKDSQCAVVVIADTSRSDVWIEDSSIAAIVIHLAAESLGLGSCWIQIRKRDHSPDKSAEEYIRELLSIPDGWAVECVIPIGYPDQQLPSRELDEADYRKVRREGF